MTPELCSNAASRDKHQIEPGGRRVAAHIAVNWGDTDLRDNMAAKPYVFCCFQCLADWATDRAAVHDDHVLQEG